LCAPVFLNLIAHIFRIDWRFGFPVADGLNILTRLYDENALPVVSEK
jgi:hypothetical protein